MRVSFRRVRRHIVSGDGVCRNADATLLCADALATINAFAYLDLIEGLF
jgi:hypothetical protein